MGKLKVKQIERDTSQPGKYFDGEGLFLRVQLRGDRLTKSWVVRYTSPESGKRREAGIGEYPGVSLDAARERCKELRGTIKAGGDPLMRDNTELLAGDVTFSQAAADFIKVKSRGWRDPKQGGHYTYTIETYCKPILSKPIGKVDRADVVTVLEPIWLVKQETALKLRSRIERILDYAVARKWRRDDLVNPAEHNERLKALLPEMPSRRQRVAHHPSMDWHELPDFMAKLKERPAVSARLLEFTILTACRIGESGGAQWRELDKKITSWSIPGGRTKTKMPHVVPLSLQAATLLKSLVPAGPGIFPIDGKSPSENATRALLIRMGRGDVTTHGFRSTFRNWCADNGYDRELAEACLAHAAGGVEGAYRRTDLLDRRRVLMQAWSDHCWSKR
jgi:integrase